MVDQQKYVYFFNEGRADMRDLLGGKGANLAEMTRLGLPVPPGFIVTTEACLDYRNSGEISTEVLNQIDSNLKRLEEERGLHLGSEANPLLVSVRSGAAVSMPGMMDTVLNLGLNSETVSGLAKSTGDERFALDCYRRFIQMFANVVKGMDLSPFERILEQEKDGAGVYGDHQLPPEGLREIINRYKELYSEETGENFPQEPREQLIAAVEAVFESWDNERARVYRNVHDIPDDMGTAVNVQAMVFGNRGDKCGTGVLFTRDPSTGESRMYGEYLPNAQGEDVVAGIRTPKSVNELRSSMPDVYEELEEVADSLERHYRDMQDVEFTVEDGELFLLQTRDGKRTPKAAVKIAHDMVEENLINKSEALMRVKPDDIAVLLHRRIDPEAEGEIIAKGLGASPGAACGKVVFDPDEAESRGKRGEKVILVRPETTPDDIHGMVEAEGVLTSRGGLTCHAAIVARGMGKSCVVGCEDLNIDLNRQTAKAEGVKVSPGDTITLDGASGRVYVGETPLLEPIVASEFEEFLSWADEMRGVGVRANADTPQDAKNAAQFGSQGIGLCRTEHMFMQSERLQVMQDMIISFNSKDRQRALEKLLPMQIEDFERIFRAMNGQPVTIRLLDPPLHEFLPDTEEIKKQIEELKQQEDSAVEVAQKEELLQRAQGLSEVNPMLGQRGCRVGILYPEIYEMQSRAIFTAAVSVGKENIKVEPEIMVPLVSDVKEFDQIAKRIREVAREIENREGLELNYSIGTMIEVPRACLVADDIAVSAEFFSFGTNDLTQTTFGFSRDDAEAKFLHMYLSEGIIEENPFAVLDKRGVGKLMEMGLRLGRKSRPQLETGICGEHGGDPESIEFCHEIGLDYVSCSPYRVPVARLAAAQAVIADKGES